MYEKNKQKKSQQSLLSKCQKKLVKLREIRSFSPRKQKSTTNLLSCFSQKYPWLQPVDEEHFQ